MKIFLPQAETITQLMGEHSRFRVGNEGKAREEEWNKKHEKMANKPFRVFSK